MKHVPPTWWATTRDDVASHHRNLYKVPKPWSPLFMKHPRYWPSEAENIWMHLLVTSATKRRPLPSPATEYDLNVPLGIFFCTLHFSCPVELLFAWMDSFASREMTISSVSFSNLIVHISFIVVKFVLAVIPSSLGSGSLQSSQWSSREYIALST